MELNFFTIDILQGLTNMELWEIGELQPQTRKAICGVFHKNDIDTPIGRSNMLSTVLQMVKSLEIAFDNQGPVVCRTFINHDEDQSIVTLEAFRPILE
jgi:hypothetical protein